MRNKIRPERVFILMFFSVNEWKPPPSLWVLKLNGSGEKEIGEGSKYSESVQTAEQYD